MEEFEASSILAQSLGQGDVPLNGLSLSKVHLSLLPRAEEVQLARLTE